MGRTLRPDHQVTFDSYTIIMIGITVFSETMIRFSSLKHFWVKKVVSVMRDDADCEQV